MKTWMIPFMTALLLPACSMHGQAGASARTDESSGAQIVGVWRGQFDNLPGVDLVITHEGGELRGAVLFYLHMRRDVNSPYTSTPGLPEPMLDLKVDGQALRFEVDHRRAHPPGSLNDAPVPFRLKLIGPGRAVLENGRESEGPPMVLTRSDY
jgi:hypothetical protein